MGAGFPFHLMQTQTLPDSIKSGLSLAEAMRRGVHLLTSREISVRADIEDAAAAYIAEKWDAIPETASPDLIVKSCAKILLQTIKATL